MKKVKEILRESEITSERIAPPSRLKKSEATSLFLQVRVQNSEEGAATTEPGETWPECTDCTGF